MRDLKDKVAVITGGGGGIGRALALAFATEGMHIALADVEEEALATVASEVTKLGVRCSTSVIDVTDLESMQAFADKVFDELGGAHIICNNAGVVTMKKAQDMSASDWDWVVGVNLYGVINGIQAFLPKMVEQDAGGHIVNTASIAGLVPEATPGIISYTASKYGVTGLTESMRLDLEQYNIGCSVVCPGGVATRIVEAGRNRPDHYGGPEKPNLDVMGSGKSVPQEMITPETLAQMILHAVQENELYVLSHPETQPAVEERFKELLAAFDKIPEA
tara:strand:+ start:332 stop:1159 length:828 start_codon:yes stop_codon:yes gene_type:complete